MVVEDEKIIDLIIRAKSGSERAFRELQKKYSGDIEGIVRRYKRTIKDMPEDDLLQEANLVMIKVIPKYDYNAHALFKTFILKCIAHKFNDFYEAEKKRREQIGEFYPLNEDSAAIGDISNSDIHKEEDYKVHSIDSDNEINMHLSLLTEEEQRIYNLSKIDKKTDKEIGAELGISTNMAAKKRKKIGFKIRRHTIYRHKF